MRQPGPPIEPAHLFQIVNRTETKPRPAKFILVISLGQMRMQPAIMLRRQFPAGTHQGLRHRKGRTRRQGNLNLRPLAPLMIFGNHPLTITEDGVFILHHAVGRQASIFHR